MRQGTTDSADSSRPRFPRFAKRLLLGIVWAVSGLAVTAFLGVVLLANLVNIGRVHRYVISLAQREATATLGAPVTLQNFALHWATLRLDLYGLTVDSPRAHLAPPLLQVNHIEATLRIVSFLHMRWYFDNVRIDHPVVQILQGSHGISNLPQPKPSANKSNVNLFEFAIHHVVLNRGELYIHDRPSAIEANLHDLTARADYDRSLHIYDGSLAYKNARLRYGSFRPIPHSLKASFRVSPHSILLKRAILSIGLSQFFVSGKLTNFSRPMIDAQYQAAIDSSQFARILRSPSLPTGMVHAVGSLHYQSVPNQPFIDTLATYGEATSYRLGVSTSGIRISSHDLGVHYALEGGSLTLRNFHGDLLGGRVTAHATIKNIGAQQRASVSAALKNISLAKADHAFLRGGTAPPVGVKGTLDATASASWGNTVGSLRAKVKIATAGKLVRAHSLAMTSADAGSGLLPDAIPVQSVLHATYRRQGNILRIHKSYLQMPHTRLAISGAVGKQSNLAIHLTTGDLRELSALATFFGAGNRGRSPKPLMVAGRAEFQGTLRGPTSAPDLSGYLDASNLRFESTRWRVLRAGIYISPSQVRIYHSDLEPYNGGRITLDASAALHQWAFNKRSPIDAILNASRVEVGDFAGLAGKKLPITGRLDARIRLHGSEVAPEGNGTVVLTDATAYKQPVQMARASFYSAGREVHGRLVVSMAGGYLKGNADIAPKRREYTAHLSSEGIRLNRLEVIEARHVEASGNLLLDVSGHGSFGNPEMNARLQVSKLVIERRPVPSFQLLVDIMNHTAHATLVSSLVNAPIAAHATLQLTGNELVRASLDTQAIPLQPLLAAYAPAEAPYVGGETEIHATLRGPLKQATLLQAHAAIPFIRLVYNKDIKLASVSPVRIDYENRVITLQPGVIRGTDTDLDFGGSIPLAGHAPTKLQVTGTVNLQLAQLLNPDLQGSGALKVDIHSNSAVNAAGLRGTIRIVNAGLTSPGLPAGLQDGNGVLTLTANRIDVTSFNGKVGGGTVTARGGVSFRPRLGFDLGMTAKHVRILYPQGVREDVDADLTFVGSPRHSILGGSIDVKNAAFTPAFDLASLVGQVASGVSAPTAPGFSQSMALDIAVRTANNLNLVSSTISVAGSANLFVRGTAANPAILGRVSLTSGNFIFNQNRFILTSGTLQFINPSQTLPDVNLALTTTVQQYNINVRFTGPMDQMRGVYTSNPSLPQADIISLLAFGQATEVTGNNQTPGNQAAESLIASAVSSRVTSRISKIAGISQLSISPVLTGGTVQGPPGAVITVRQQITGNLFITFSTNVASTQDEIVQGEYKLSPKVALSVTRDPYGGLGAEVLIKKKW